MNQGDNDSAGPYRDGALIIDFPNSATASGLFIKFQNQVWHTDEATSAPLPGAPRVPVQPIPETGDTVAPGRSSPPIRLIVSPALSPPWSTRTAPIREARR